MSEVNENERESDSEKERENEDDAILFVVNAQAQSVQRKSINDPPKCLVKITHSDFQLQSILYIYTIYPLFVSVPYPCIYPCGAQRRALCRLIETSQRNGFIEAVAVSI